MQREAVLSFKAPPTILALQLTQTFLLIINLGRLHLTVLSWLDINLHQCFHILIVNIFCWVVQVFYDFLVFHLVYLSHRTSKVYNDITTNTNIKQQSQGDTFALTVTRKCGKNPTGSPPGMHRCSCAFLTYLRTG